MFQLTLEIVFTFGAVICVVFVLRDARDAILFYKGTPKDESHPYTHHLIGEYEPEIIKELDEYFNRLLLEDSLLKTSDIETERLNSEIKNNNKKMKSLAKVEKELKINNIYDPFYLLKLERCKIK